VSPVKNKAVTVSAATAADIANNRPKNVTTCNPTKVTPSSNPTNVATGGGMGAQGPQGPAGTGDSDVAPINFSYGDAGSDVFTPAVAGTITVLRLVVLTPFNGSAPSLVLGKTGSLDAAMAATDNDLLSEGEYEITADMHLDVGESLRITITPDGSTAGAGVVFAQFVED